MLKLIILDRDGTINEDRDDYVKSPEEWVPIEGSMEAIARLSHAGWRIVIASNQSGLGRGLFDMATLNAMHEKMHKLLALVGGKVEAIFFCPHTTEEGCDCRKPLSGLYDQISSRLGVSLKGVPTVGDSLRDLQAGYGVGCEPHLVLSGKGAVYRDQALSAQFPKETRIHQDLYGFSEWMLHERDVQIEALRAEKKA